LRILFLQTAREESLVGSFLRAAEGLGCDCRVFDLQGAVRDAGRSLPGPIVRRAFRWHAWDRAGRRLLEETAGDRFDLLFQIKGRELAPAVLAELKARAGAPLVVYYPDSPFERRSTSRRFLRALPLVDLFLTFDGSWCPELLRRGVRRAEVVPFARDPTLHRPVDLSPERRRELETEVAFVGSWSHERESWLTHLGDFRLGLWGDPIAGRWHGALAGLYRGGPVDARGTSEILSATRIAVNLVRNWEEMRATPPARGAGGYWGQGHNMRSFEAAACGAFVLSTRTRQLREMFHEGEEVELFGSVEELRAKVRYYLDHDDERRRIAAAGRARVEAETYERRMRRILDLVKESCGDPR